MTAQRVLHFVGINEILPTSRNMPRKTPTERLLTLATRQAVVRPRDVEAVGIAREYLLRACRRGLLVRIARGTYTLANASSTEHHGLAAAAMRVPGGVVCLLSALRFHDMTTQDPREVWMAIDVKARKPVTEWPPLHIVRFSGRALSDGVGKHVVEGVPLKVYSVAKTVADCFKYRHKIGTDIAIEALRDALRTRKSTVDEIHHYAKICRVANVMRPYMESVV